MSETGIKFKCEWIKGEAPGEHILRDLDHWRDVLYSLKMIGEGSDGIGYGNVSKRATGDHFVITGAATGKIHKLSDRHYTTVVSFDIAENKLRCEGPIIASSESMTHGTVYASNVEIGAVVHIHHAELWRNCLYRIPTTGAEVPYGTPAMAKEIMRLFAESDLPYTRVLAMAGHQDGLLSFGMDPREAVETITALLI
jgi:L-ribulose-5-phosphate 4-epimerase